MSWRRLKLLKPKGIRRVLEEAKPEVVVHAAAYTDVDGCEDDRDRALRVNYLATAHIARRCARLGCGVIYVSTDYVFDGTREIYSEEEPPAPSTPLPAAASTPAAPMPNPTANKNPLGKQPATSTP